MAEGLTVFDEKYLASIGVKIPSSIDLVDAILEKRRVELDLAAAVLDDKLGVPILRAIPEDKPVRLSQLSMLFADENPDDITNCLVKWALGGAIRVDKGGIIRSEVGSNYLSKVEILLEQEGAKRS